MKECLFAFWPMKEVEVTLWHWNYKYIAKYTIQLQDTFKWWKTVWVRTGLEKHCVCELNVNWDVLTTGKGGTERQTVWSAQCSGARCLNWIMYCSVSTNESIPPRLSSIQCDPGGSQYNRLKVQHCRSSVTNPRPLDSGESRRKMWSSPDPTV